MSCAGTIGTCTHGTGKDYGLLATFVSNKLFILNKLQSRIKYILTCYMLDGKILTEIYMEACKGNVQYECIFQLLQCKIIHILSVHSLNFFILDFLITSCCENVTSHHIE